MERRIESMWVQKSKKPPCIQKECICNLSTCTCKNVKYLRSIIGDSVITCDEITEVTKIIPTKTTLVKNCSKKFKRNKGNM